MKTHHLLLLVLSGCAHGQLISGVDELPYPPPRPPARGDIFHVPTGLQMSFEAALEVISGARLVCIGETHDDILAHQVELAHPAISTGASPDESQWGWRCSANPSRALADAVPACPAGLRAS